MQQSLLLADVAKEHTEVILGISLTAIALIQGIVGYFFRGLLERVKEIEKNASECERTMIVLGERHKGTAEAILNLRNDLDGWQKDIRKQIDGVHDRINDLDK